MFGELQREVGVLCGEFVVALVLAACAVAPGPPRLHGPGGPSLGRLTTDSSPRSR